MASIKAIAAIALTLMIAVPIGLGYAFASEEQTVTYWQTESSTNATDLLLNNETPYYYDIVGAQNNKTLLQKQVYIGAGVTEWHQVAPDYVTVGTSTTPIPTYSTSTATYSLGSTSTATYTLNYSANASVGTSGSGADITVSPAAANRYTITTNATAPHWSLTADDNTLYGPQTVTVLKDGGSTWTIYAYDYMGTTTVYTGITDFAIVTDADGTVTNTYRGYTPLSINGDYTFIAPTRSSIAITYSTNSVDYAAVDSNTAVTLAGTTAYVGTSTYTGVTRLSVAPTGTSTSLSYDVNTADGYYADPADGWHLPTLSTAATFDYWLNGQLNEEVRLMVSFSGAGYAYLGPVDELTDSYKIELHYTGSTMTVEDVSTGTEYTLGTYSKVMVVMGIESATVYGLADWPTLGIYPATYNNVTVDYDDLSGPFTYVRMQGTDAEDVSFRMDYASAVAGYFPSTLDKWLYFSEIYPGQSLVFTIKSIAVYGDSLQIGGMYYTVADGKITGTDTDGDSFTVALRGAAIRYVYDADSSRYIVTVGGHEITTEGLGRIYFGGEWSLTASIALATEQTSTQAVWVPGEFAFDKEDFAACGLIVAGLCMVGLGMTGARSGAKMGVLLIICGGAGLIYLTLI